ncbi:MAG: formate dehydrogenase accessory sulfurtransferase FdhD [Anaerolineae bacterium]|nr:formate dehydrogenase accessory sulfurtransferase FdhD [Anaerolineae bacterium]MCB0206491.1 formate dehydrogenase accessory sulfurtransferase FdhD [Anaerolineae bacterium]MCB0254450.1 formate dehydrogenase accessory sulfurtransferase FdhD [Anaerolineae bacterium]
MSGSNGAFDWQYVRWERGAPTPVDGVVIHEEQVRIHVNGVELVAFMCTPKDLDQLALGFLRSEGIIQDIADVRLIHTCPSETCVEVWLRDAAPVLPQRVIVTSGCGGGVTFDDLSQRVPPVESAVTITARQVNDSMRQLMDVATLYRLTRGVHTSALSDGQRIIAQAEDVGRHNTIDKLWGYCLQQGIATADRILLATGRISSEMLNKAAKMRIPVVASRTSPTSLSVQLAREWNITLIGYARGENFNVYAAGDRIRPTGSLDKR